jgi:hypothetical protein
LVPNQRLLLLFNMASSVHIKVNLPSAATSLPDLGGTWRQRCLELASHGDRYETLAVYMGFDIVVALSIEWT